jgi:hypothetical protein
LDRDEPIWVYTENGPASGIDMALGVAAGAESEIVVTGFQETEDEWDMFLSRLDADGELDWTLDYPDASDGYDVAVCPEGDYCVAGVSTLGPEPEPWVILRCHSSELGPDMWTQGDAGEGPAGTDAAEGVRALTGTVPGVTRSGWIQAYDPDGETLVEIPLEDYTTALDVAVDEDGNLIAVGELLADPGHAGAWLRSYDLSGTLLWSADEIGSIERREVARTPDGDVAVVSWLPDEEAVLVAVHAAEDGAEIWRDVFDGGEGWDDLSLGVAVDADGNVVVAGVIDMFEPSASSLMRKYDPAGTLLWERRWSPEGDDPLEINAVTTDPEGAVIVAGAVRDPDEHWNILVAKFHP